LNKKIDYKPEALPKPTEPPKEYRPILKPKPVTI
jgi:hypothetical protein